MDIFWIQLLLTKLCVQILAQKDSLALQNVEWIHHMIYSSYSNFQINFFQGLVGLELSSTLHVPMADIPYSRCRLVFFQKVELQFLPPELSKLCLWCQLRRSQYISGALRRAFFIRKVFKESFFVVFCQDLHCMYVHRGIIHRSSFSQFFLPKGLVYGTGNIL